MTSAESTEPQQRRGSDALVSLARGESPTRREGDRELPLGDRARRTREALLMAAWTVFSEKGYRAAQPADIAARANVSVGTFYQYFRSRSDVMAVLVAEAIRQTTGPSERWRPSDGRSGLERFITRYVQGYCATAPFQRAWEEATHADATLAEVRRDLGGWLTDSVERALRRMTIPEGADPALLARALTGMLDRYLYLTYVFDPPQPLPTPEESAATLLAVCTSVMHLD